MPYQETNGIRYFTSNLLQVNGITHAVFTRNGGVSPAPWNSLNVGSTVGDEFDRVLENRRRTFAALDRAQDSLYDVWQVHGDRVVSTMAPRPPQAPHEKADAILTDQPDVTLYMRFADCVPILLYDPTKRVVGLVHAGWKGTVLAVAGKTVQRMQTTYDSHPEDVRAFIGPSIGPDHYEVGPEVIRQVEAGFGGAAEKLLSPNGKGVHLDLWTANRLVLEGVGVRQIEVAGICTACHLEDWFSHRAESGKTGRFGALIALK